MEEKFILNLIHRPELAPEYAEKVTGHGKKEDISRSDLRDESLDIFIFQQDVAHRNGLRTTIEMTYASLFSEEACRLAKEHHEKYGDEIGLSLLGLPCKEFREKYKTKDFCIWMFSSEDKKAIVDDVFAKFYECFGFYPHSTGSYYMDAELTNYIKEKYPEVVCAVATCWEEGPKAYHTCNNSWYTLMDGGPWAPWIPSKQNTHAPAANEAEDSGIVAIPHLSRDLLACYDGNGSNFGTHPQNVLRGMIYRDGEYPYLFNLVDQYRHLAKYNDGIAYNMMFVGPGWLNKLGRWESPYELLAKSYEDGLGYYGQLKKEGKLIDMTMEEFAHFYRENKHYEQPECALWKDILYGSDKQVFWYCDPYMRAGIDMNQGGALFDLRPYVSKLDWKFGIGTKRVQDVSYPFLIQMNYRAGYFTHYAGEGTIRSCKISWKGQETDMCLCRTKAHFSKDGTKRVLTLDPVDIVFDGLSAKIQTVITFEEGSSRIDYRREILEISDENEKLDIHEYITACYGTTEYPEDMSEIVLSAEGAEGVKTIDYAYKNRTEEVSAVKSLSAVIPPIETKVTFGAIEEADGYVTEGYAFSPMFTLGIKKALGKGEVLTSWLSLQKEV